MKSYNIVLHNIEFTFYIYESAPFENLNYSEPHIHALPELFIILEGDAVISGDFGSEKITNREVCLIPPKIFHDVVNDFSYSRLAIKFSLKKLENKSKLDLFSAFSGVLTDKVPFIMSFNPIFIAEIFNCLKNQAPLNDEKLKGLLLLIFIEIYESLSKHPKFYSKQYIPNIKQSKALWLANNDILLHRYAKGDFSIKELEKSIFLTRRQISRILCAEYGMNLNEFRIQTRMRRALFLLQKTDFSLKEISETLNFSSQESFTICFKKHFGFTPLTARRQKV